MTSLKDIWRFTRSAATFLTVSILLFFSYLMLRITLPYLSFRQDVDFLLTKQAIIHITPWRVAFYVHICTSIFVLVCGIFQFIKVIARRYRKIHRALGKIYVFCVLFLSGPSGWLMAIYANGGIRAQIGFVCLATAWIAFTFLAFYYAKRGKIGLHTDFMTRSYALTLSAITLRLYAYLIPHIFHLNGQQEYVILAWAAWVPNLIIAEILIRAGVFSFEKKQKRGPSVPVS